MDETLPKKTSDLIWQDTQHQTLFRLIEEIKTVPFDPDIFQQLRLYTEHHFVIGEEYMKALNYPGLDEHVTAHNRFREEMRAMIDTDPSISPALQNSLSDFLYKWLKLHVLGIDKELEAFIQASNQK